jgi:uncharacterized phage protein gp47/JayE
MIQKPLSSTTYDNNLLAGLLATGITQTATGGKARSIVDNIADQMGTLESRQFTNLVQTLLPYAVKDTLDFLGGIEGLPRIAQVDATVAQTDNNFQFFVRFGTFGSINNGNDIIVPAGTQLYTADGVNGVIYVTQVDITLPAASSQVFFAADALTTGAGGQVASGVFSSSSFAGYTDARYGSLLITNLLGIISGRDAESDDDYRFRISLKIQSSGGSQLSDIEAAVLQVTGVQNVTFARLAGTFIAYVYGISPDIGASLLQNVQTVINNTVAYPNSGLAVAPDLVGISLATTVSFVPGTTVSTVAQVLQTAATAVQSYIDNLAIQSTFVINQVASVILNSDPSILDIGQPNQPLNSIFIWRSRADGTRFSRTLIGDYLTQLGERLVTENIVNAIQITQAATN